MGQKKYLLALVPLVVVWLIAVGSSVGSFYSLIDSVSGVPAHDAVAVEDAGQKEPPGLESTSTVHSASAEPVDEAATAAQLRSHEVIDRRPLPAPPPNAGIGTYDSLIPDGTHVSREQYEEGLRGITDPRIRAAVVPAIED